MNPHRAGPQDARDRSIASMGPASAVLAYLRRARQLYPWKTSSTHARRSTHGDFRHMSSTSLWRCPGWGGGCTNIIESSGYCGECSRAKQRDALKQLAKRDVAIATATLSMTLNEKEDPQATTDRCMRCGIPERYRNVSTIGNGLRLWTCNPCQCKLLALVQEWLRSESA